MAALGDGGGFVWRAVKRNLEKSASSRRNGRRVASIGEGRRAARLGEGDRRVGGGRFREAGKEESACMWPFCGREEELKGPCTPAAGCAHASVRHNDSFCHFVAIFFFFFLFRVHV